MLLLENDPGLHQETARYVFDDKEEALKVAALLKEIMITNHGVGLAAPQIGLNERVFVMGHWATPDDIITVFNPFIVETSEEVEMVEEGCLSYPDLFLKVKRPKSIRARFVSEDGVVQTMNFSGMTARVFQHEMDHLDGITMDQRANRYHLEKARKDRKLKRRKAA